MYALTVFFSVTVTDASCNEYNTRIIWLFKDYYYCDFGRL